MILLARLIADVFRRWIFQNVIMQLADAWNFWAMKMMLQDCVVLFASGVSFDFSYSQANTLESN